MEATLTTKKSLMDSARVIIMTEEKKDVVDRKERVIKKALT
jgi:hypothetical protein